MKPFPGTITHDGANHHRIELNNEQREWLAHYYPKIENERLSNAMGISIVSVRVQARQLGLEKSEAGLRAIRRRQAKAAAKTNERNGCYARKRGHPPSEATLKGNLKRWEETRQGLRDDPMTMLRKHHQKKYQAAMEKKRNERKESIRKEKMRIIYGLERKTKLKVVVLNPYTRSQTHHRHSALQRGYLLDTDCSEGQPGRYVIYYDDETQRSAKFEANCIKDGFTFKRDE
jgi:hypothetical protein